MLLLFWDSQVVILADLYVWEKRFSSGTDVICVMNQRFVEVKKKQRYQPS